MSDDDRDIDVESDDDDSDTASSSRPSSRSFNSSKCQGPNFSQAEKRAHHNALERKRRDHIKDSFSSLRDSVPCLNGEKASRAQILKKASEYILAMRKKNQSHLKDIDDLERQNNIIEAQIRKLENQKARFTTVNFKSEDDREAYDHDKDSSYNETESESDADASVQTKRNHKRLKTNCH